MPLFKIIHERPKCIACGSCAAVAPKYWEMSEKDGLADLKGCTMNGENEERIVDEKEAVLNKEAADVCPVQIIHVDVLRNEVSGTQEAKPLNEIKKKDHETLRVSGSAKTLVSAEKEITIEKD